MDQQKIARINELARKSKTTPLSDAELKEQAELRKEYIAAFRNSLRQELSAITVVESDGSKHKLKKKGTRG